MIGGQVIFPKDGDVSKQGDDVVTVDPIQITVHVPPDEVEAPPLCISRYDPLDEALGLGQSVNPATCVPVLSDDCAVIKDRALIQTRYDKLIGALEKNERFKKSVQIAGDKARRLVWASAIDSVEDPKKALALLDAVISSNPKDVGATMANATADILSLCDYNRGKSGTAVELVTLAYAKAGDQLEELTMTSYVDAAQAIGLTPEDALDILRAMMGAGKKTTLGYAYCIRDLTKSFQDLATSGTFFEVGGDKLKAHIIAVIISAGDDADIAVRELPKRLSEAIYRDETDAVLKTLKKNPDVQELLKPDAPWQFRISEADLASFVRTCVERGITNPSNIALILNAMKMKAIATAYGTIKDEIKGSARIISDARALGIRDQVELAALVITAYKYYLGEVTQDIAKFMGMAKQCGYSTRQAITIVDAIGRNCGGEGFAAIFALRKLAEMMKKPDVLQFAREHRERFQAIVTAAAEGAQSKSYLAFDVLPDILKLRDILSVSTSSIHGWFMAAADEHRSKVVNNVNYDDMTSIWMMPHLVAAGLRDYDSLTDIMHGMPINYHAKKSDIGKLAEAIPIMDKRLERAFGIRDQGIRLRLITAAIRSDSEDPAGALARLPDVLAKIGVDKLPADRIVMLIELVSCDTRVLGDYNRFVELMQKRGANQKFIDYMLDYAINEKDWKAKDVLPGLIHMLESLDQLGLENLEIGTLQQYLDEGVISMPCWVQVRQGAEVLNKMMPDLAARQKFLADLSPFLAVQFLSFLANSARDERIYKETPATLLAKCREIEGRFGLIHWKNYSYKVVDYLLHTEKYNSGYDIRIVEASNDWDLANAIEGLPDYSRPRIELNGHGTPEYVRLGNPISLDTSAAEFLHMETIGKALSDYHLVSPDESSVFALLKDCLSFVRLRLPSEHGYLDKDDIREFTPLKKKFEDDPSGRPGPRKKPLIYAITTADHNGGFNDVYKDIEVLIDYAMDTSKDPVEVNFHSCSTGKGDDNIAKRVSVWFGGVKVVAPPVDVSSKLAVEDGRVVPVYVSDGRPVNPTVYRGR